MTNINEINEKVWAEIKNAQKVEIEDTYKNSKLGNIFVAAVLTAADKSQRDLSKWAGTDGKINVYEMAKAIEEINEKNIKLRGNYKDKTVKVRDKDRYTGRNERAKNSEGEKAAFYLLNQVDSSFDIYDWKGKNGKDQLEQRTEEINSGRRDAEKAVRVMLRELNQDKIGQLVEEATKESSIPETETTNTDAGLTSATETDTTETNPSSEASTTNNPTQNPTAEQPEAEDTPSTDEQTTEVEQEGDKDETITVEAPKYKSNPQTQQRIWESNQEEVENWSETAEECQNYIDTLKERHGDKIDDWKKVIDFLEAKLKTFPEEEQAKVKSDEFREQRSQDRKTNAQITETLGEIEQELISQYGEQVNQNGIFEKLGDAANLSLTGKRLTTSTGNTINNIQDGVNWFRRTQSHLTTDEYLDALNGKFAHGELDKENAKQCFAEKEKYEKTTALNTLERSYSEILLTKKSAENLNEIENKLKNLSVDITQIEGYQDLPIEEKIKKIEELANNCINEIGTRTQALLGEQSYEDFAKQHEQRYTDFITQVGLKSAQERVANYRKETTENGQIAKSVAVAIATIATAGTAGIGLVGTSVVAGTLTSAASALNRATNNIDDNKDLYSLDAATEIAKEGAIAGVTTYVGGKVLGAVAGKVMSSNMSTANKLLTLTSTDMGFGAGFEYLTTGKITAKGTALNGAFALTGFGANLNAVRLASKANKIPLTLNKPPYGELTTKTALQQRAKAVGADGKPTYDALQAQKQLQEQYPSWLQKTKNYIANKADNAMKPLDDIGATSQNKLQNKKINNEKNVENGTQAGTTEQDLPAMNQGSQNKSFINDIKIFNEGMPVMIQPKGKNIPKDMELQIKVTKNGEDITLQLTRGADETPIGDKISCKLSDIQNMTQTNAQKNGGIYLDKDGNLAITESKIKEIDSIKITPIDLKEPVTPDTQFTREKIKYEDLAKKFSDLEDGASITSDSIPGCAGCYLVTKRGKNFDLISISQQEKKLIDAGGDLPNADYCRRKEYVSADNTLNSKSLNSLNNGGAIETSIVSGVSENYTLNIIKNNDIITFRVFDKNVKQVGKTVEINAKDINTLTEANAQKNGGIYVDESGNIRLTDSKLQEINTTNTPKTNTSTNAKGVEALPSGRHTANLERLITKDEYFVTPNAKGLPKNTELMVSKEKDFITFRVCDKNTMMPIGEKVKIKINDIGTLTKENASKNGGIYVDTDGYLAITESNAIKTKGPTAPKATKGNTPKTVEAITSQHEPQGAFRQESLQQNQSIEVSGNAHIKLSNKYVLNLERLNIQDGQEVTIGRGSEADIRISNANNTVSKIHLTVKRNGNNYTVTDRSINGTRVYGDEIKAAKNPNISHSKQQVSHYSRLTQLTDNHGFSTPNAKGLPENCRLEVSKNNNTITFRVLDKSGNQVGKTVEINARDINTLTEANAQKNGGIYVDESGNIRLTDSKFQEINPSATQAAKATKGNTPKTVEAITSQHEPQGAFRQQRLQENQSIEVSGNAHIQLSNKYVLNLERLNIQDGQKVTIGRGSEADIRISNADDTVSRRHLTVERKGNNYIVTDHSINGTRVYGDEIKAAKNPNISHSEQPALQVSHYSRLTQLTDNHGFSTPNAKGLPKNTELIVLKEKDFITFRVCDKNTKNPIGEKVQIKINDIGTLTKENASKNGGIYLDKDGKLVITESNAIKTKGPSTKEPITEAQIIEYANKLKNGESIRLSEAHGIPNGLSITITKDANGKITYFKPESWDANPKNGTVIYEEVNI